MELLSMNVSVNKVNDVIRTVIKRLTNKNIDRLPSVGLRSQFLIEARHLADIQVGNALLQDADLTSVLGNTLHGDGTTKYHRHYQNFQVTTAAGKSLSVGLCEVVGQDAETILKTWQERVKEIAAAITRPHDGALSANVNRLVASIKNTMSDQCATNGVFTSILQDLRKQVMPNVIEKWEQFSEDERSSVLEMGNFFCKVHPLATFAEEANKSMVKFEKAVLEGKSKCALPSGSESGTVRSIRTVCSAFQQRGNQQAGMSENFKAYLDEIGSPLQLVQFEGNRFNVVFHNGGAVYHHLQHILDFIDQKHTQNRLLQAVAEDLKNDVFVAGTRAFGIVSKLITGPYFRLVGELKSIFELNPFLAQLQDTLHKLSKDASPLLEGKGIFDEEFAKIKRDVVYESLMSE
eukprot:Seg720.1 transcript_id=Seg720.1/GoldUCD/mRNA.D3Y31 product="hypothetical protein" protein_id=Seg720.1/GoldUCD/D3Y31